MKTYRSDQFTDSGFYVFRHNCGGFDAPHRHNFTELVYIAEGVCSQTVDGIEYRACAGDLILIEEGATHAFRTLDGGFSYVNLILTHDFLDRYAKDTLLFGDAKKEEKYRITLYGRERALLERLLDEMTHELLADGDGQLAVIGGMVRTCLALYSRALHRRENPSRDGSRFASLLAEIEGRLGENLTLSSLAASAGYDEEYFCRAFRRAVGKSPMAYVTERRVLRAAALLSGTDLSVSEVGARCGFTDRSVMARAFQKVLGKSPREVRGGPPKAE